MKHLKLEQAQLFLKQRFNNKENMVFINDQHNIPGNVAVNDVIKRIQRDLGIKKENYLSFHALRHTHASILIARGISLEYVSARLGHANTMITSQTYVHLLKDRKEQDAQAAINMNSTKYQKMC